MRENKSLVYTKLIFSKKDLTFLKNSIIITRHPENKGVLICKELSII